MKNITLYIWLILSLMIPINTQAEQLVFNALDDFPPYQYLDEKKQATGIDIDIIKEIASRLSIDVKFQIVPWQRALIYAQKGKTEGIAAAIYKKERESFLTFTKEPIHVQKNVIIAPKKDMLKINGLKDLTGKNMGVIRGFSYGAEFDAFKGLNKKVGNNMLEMVRMLQRGAIDVVATSEKPFRFICNQLNYKEPLDIVYVMEEIPVFIVFSKAKGESGKIWAEKFSQSLGELKTTGMLDQITAKYIK